MWLLIGSLEQSHAFQLGEAIHSSTPRSPYALASTEADDDTPIPLTDRRTRRMPSDGDSILSGVSGDDAPPQKYENDTHSPAFRDVANISARASRTNLTDEEADSPKENEFASAGRSVRFALDVAGGEDDETESVDGDNVAGHGGVGDKAGIILVRKANFHSVKLDLHTSLAQGIHNIFVVIPQFLVTALSAVIFAIFEPQRSVTDVTPIVDAGKNVTTAALAVRILLKEIDNTTRPFDSIGFMFR